jgi:transcriptional regulator with GAF, ATPase, and Fis domain
VVPPLRDRADDILLLAKRFREEASFELCRPVAAISDEAARSCATTPGRATCVSCAT